MCTAIGVSSPEDLIDQTIPSHIRWNSPMHLSTISRDSVSETAAQAKLRTILKDQPCKASFIGQGYYGTLVPAVIQRNVLENPQWYTSYTPYQAEISQGRLETLFAFQTLTAELTGLPVANASLLDEGSAAAEAISMFMRGSGKRMVFIDDHVFNQTAEVVATRAEFLGVKIIRGTWKSFDFSDPQLLAAIVQYPDACGRVFDFSEISKKLKAHGGNLAVAADPLALCLLAPPGNFGASAVFGSFQRFGVPMWFGGPSAAFFATTAQNIRKLPGRLVGQSVDAAGNPALRLTLQTREQHIRLDKATSNVCTTQALLANMAALFAIYHGPSGLKGIASRVQSLTDRLAAGLEISSGFGTVVIPGGLELSRYLEEDGIHAGNFNGQVTASVDETHTEEDILLLVNAVRKFQGRAVLEKLPETQAASFGDLAREGALLPQAAFNSMNTETEMMRYLTRLHNKDLSLCHSMITLGSCTMKLNAAASLQPCSWPSIVNLHPFSPKSHSASYMQILESLKSHLCRITGFDACSLQPTSGASGEYAGLLAIRKFQVSQGQPQRKVCIIPKSAHGTNSASAAMIGMEIKWIDDSNGVNLEVLAKLCHEYKETLSCLMVTYPSTHGVFEVNIDRICSIVHDHGGQVYMDGANMNAQLGLTSPALIGADVCHLNLHKTFSIPHGGGGPGLGPICVKSHLAPFLPGEGRVGNVSSAPYGQAGIAVIPWMFIEMLGPEGLKQCAIHAILNANYMMTRLSKHFPMKQTHGRCSHEFIIDLAEIKASTGVTEEDIAKRLIDYGFHAPTMSWPVPNSLMVEPTESESKDELDRFCDSLISIKGEIDLIKSGKWTRDDNPLKNAPHTQQAVCASEWLHPYSREVAAFPLSWISERGKFWPSVARVSNVIGDRNLILKLEK